MSHDAALGEDVVIWGGSGFIGRHLVQSLLGRARSITVVSRGVVDGTIDSLGVWYRRGDLQDAESAARVIAGATVVYDLSLPLGASWSQFPRRCLTSAANLAEASLQHSVRRVVYASTSDAVYLGARRTVTERDGTDPKPHLRNPYSQGKAAAERLLFDLHKSRKLPVVVFRPFLVVGRGGRPNHGGIGHWVGETCCLGWGNGLNLLPFVLVQDVAAAMAAAISAPNIEGRAFNLAGDVLLSARQYIDLLAKHSRRNFRFFPRNLHFLGIREAITYSLKRLARRNAERVTYHDMLSSSKQSTVDCSAAKSLLAWRPNSDLEFFCTEAIDSHFQISNGDLRLEP